eukprot:gnl/MRDRNA2_/MRDRNA2_125568_c0_seq1.p1 gnl/MRDRNA2_/MRDRNA2_125568_c0~~gnl/MRDRNA2_/MRDRNA2_125568_c0_seq1.p1  ORF type:complete len:444 (+),score=73.78 gnl/MRDRNA2_/MRDRNA2_125568_c0_seq1:73-1404(+)
MAMAINWISLFGILGPVVAAASLPAELTSAFDDVAKKMSEKYNCSISIAFRNADGEAAAARGTADFSTNRQASTRDVYAWGSITKMLTAASIMKLVSEGAFHLDHPVAPLVNPIIAKMAKSNPNQNFSSVEEIWGPQIKKTTVRQLLSMQSGVPDFDTANPNSQGGASEDPLRAELYRDPKHFYSPSELMNVNWVRGHWVDCKWHWPMGSFCYSSTNFMLLGLILASHAGADTWTAFDQASFLPPYLKSQIQFALKGAPADYDAAHGYDRTPYNMPKGETNNHDDAAVDGVFAGWTASNIVANASSLASLAWEIYGPPSSIAKKTYVNQMIPKYGIYGLGTFNLAFLTGHRQSSLGIGYGHLGATYGYQSLAGYFPTLNIAMSIASNIETFNQVQPSETFCHAYNAAAGILQGKAINCEFKSSGYYGGACECSSTSQESEILV